MIAFSSIVLELQLLIVKKMDYFDQIPFEISSKTGKVLVEFSKDRIIHVENLILHEEPGFSPAEQGSIYTYKRDAVMEDLYITIETVERRITMRLKTLPYRTQLPRFNAPKITMIGQKYWKTNHVAQLIEAAEFTDCEVQLEVTQPYMYCSLDAPVFQKLTEVFNITSSVLRCCTDLDLFENPKFLELKMIFINTDWFPSHWLPRMKCKTIIYEERMSVGNMPKIINFMFKQWFRKEREIESFQVVTRLQCAFDYEHLFPELPFNHIWEFDETLWDDAFKINRGDKNLCVYVKDCCRMFAEEEELEHIEVIH